MKYSVIQLEEKNNTSKEVEYSEGSEEKYTIP